MAEGIRVLHVDDESGFAETTTIYLEREDDRFSVETASSGADGLDRLTDGFDCVVSDYEMPGMDGIEFLSAVREEYPDLPFILFTGKGSEEIASDAISAGVTDYLRKRAGPEQYELLATRIRTAVGQYRAERELERQNDLFEKAQDLADVGAWEWNPQDQTGHYSEQVYEIYGVDPDHKGTPEEDIRRFYHPEDRDTVRDAIEGAIESGDHYDIEVRVTAADGTEKWVRTRGEPHFEDGTCTRVRGTIRDITERKRRERELRETTLKLESLVEAFPDVAFIKDVEGNYLEAFAGPETESLLYSGPEAYENGQHVTDVFDSGEAERVLDTIRRAVDTGTIQSLEYRLDVPSGLRWFEGRIAPIDGTIQGRQAVVWVARDITGRKEREQDLQRQNERLDEFVSVVSHDLRNPLHTLSGSLELIETDDEAELQRCRQSVDRMERLLDDLLTLARQGETDSEAVPIRLDAVASECARTAVPPDVELSVETDATIRAENARLKQLLENLFANAVEHGGEGVSITVGDTEDGFYVADDGVGIPAEERETCFEIGYSTSDDGTGFGLNIVKQIVAAHGWEIHVTESDEGGAGFEISGVERVT